MKYLSVSNFIAVIIMQHMTFNIAYADGSAYQICNKSGKDFAVAYLYRAGLGMLSSNWKWKGYYLVKSGECGYHLDTHGALHAMINFRAVSKAGKFGKDLRLTKGDYSLGWRSVGLFPRSSAELGADYCTYKSGEFQSMPIEKYKTCRSNNTARSYSVYWHGSSLPHKEINQDGGYKLTVK